MIPAHSIYSLPPAGVGGGDGRQGPTILDNSKRPPPLLWNGTRANIGYVRQQTLLGPLQFYGGNIIILPTHPQRPLLWNKGRGSAALLWNKGPYYSPFLIVGGR